MTKPLVVVFLGVPGSGKTYFATRLAKKLHAVTLNSDAMRLAIWGSREAVRKARPTPELRIVTNTITFGAMEYAAKQILQTGMSVLHDANANQRDVRRKTAEFATKHGAIPIVVRIHTTSELALKRMQEREDTDDQLRFEASKAQLVLESFTNAIEEPGPDEQVITIDGEVPFDEQYVAFTRQLEDVLQKL